MNYPILSAGLLVLLALLAHFFIGTREALSARPTPQPSAGAGTEAVVIERNWVQSLCAFQMVTVDLLVMSVLLLVVGATDLIPNRSIVAIVAAGVISLWGVTWLIQLFTLRRPALPLS